MQFEQPTELSVSTREGKKKVIGSAQAGGVAALEFDLSNGEVECVVGDAKPGEVKLSWTIKRQKGGVAKAGKPSDLEVRLEQNGNSLKVIDHWHGKKTASRPSIHLVMVAHPDTLVSGSMGNGNLAVENHKISGLSLGNGRVVANGELAGNAGISMGNGDVRGSLLIAAGEHSISIGNGAVKVKAVEGSSFNLNSSVGIGKITIDGAESDREWGFLGGSVSAKIGSGAGSLDICAGNGKVLLEVASGH